MSSNFNDIISVLDSINKEVNVPVYIPSLNKEVGFKSINTGQQKSLLKAAVDNPVFQTRFTIALYNLINENILDKTVVSKLTTIDSAIIAVQLRAITNGNTYVLQQNGRKYNVDLKQVIDNAKNVFTWPTDSTVNEAPFSVDVGLPLLVEQYNIEKQLREKSLNDQQIVTAQLTDTIGDAFIGEVSKFIKEITVMHDNKEQKFEYKSLPYTKRHTILEKIPTTVVQGVLKFMERYVTIQKDILTISGTDTETNEVVNDLVLTVDTSLFIIS